MKKIVLMYTPPSQEDLHMFRSICGNEQVFTDHETCKLYGKDETEDLVYVPAVVVKPLDTGQVAQLLRYCNIRMIAVTPRGAGTGLSGGALPVYGGVLLSMEKFNRILEIDEQNLQCTVEPGVINEVLAISLREKGLFYPPDPASRGSCFLGGNVAHNSGGPKAVKYGVTRDYVLNLEVVLPDGSVIKTGSDTLKNSTGYSLTHLFIGSEGTLGVVTKIVLRLIPLPAYQLLMLVPFNDATDACKSVAAVFNAGIIPSAMEFMERDAIDWTLRFHPEIKMDIDHEVQAHLLIEVDGNNMDILRNEAEIIYNVVANYNCGDILLAETESQKNDLWKLRRKVAEAVKRNSVYKEEDTVVKRYELPNLLKGVKQIGSKYGFKSVCYGHAGDGNLHVNIIKGDLDDQTWNEILPNGIQEIFSLCVALGGTISGEHGIGWVQKRYLPIAQSEIVIQLQKQIKKVFDPNGIMNPGKIFPGDLLQVPAVKQEITK